MLERLQLNIHYSFRQVKLLELALTHSSYSNEHPDGTGHNERLEFLGDAVLELAVSSLLYKRLPEAREGELTDVRARMVSQPALAVLARELKLDEELFLGRGEEEQGGREREALLSDAFEAVLGAIFLDGGWAAAAGAAEALLMPRLEAARQKARGRDDKSLLQELTQKLFQSRPVYVLKGCAGPEHARIFKVELALPDGRVYLAEGSSLKKAEQAAAAAVLKDLGRDDF